MLARSLSRVEEAEEKVLADAADLYEGVPIKPWTPETASDAVPGARRVAPSNAMTAATSAVKAAVPQVIYLEKKPKLSFGGTAPPEGAGGGLSRLTRRRLTVRRREGTRLQRRWRKPMLEGQLQSAAARRPPLPVEQPRHLHMPVRRHLHMPARRPPLPAEQPRHLHLTLHMPVRHGAARRWRRPRRTLPSRGRSRQLRRRRRRRPQRMPRLRGRWRNRSP